MSNVPSGDKVETQQQQQKGPEAYLSGEERKQLQRMLGYPEDLPKKFGTWMLDFISVNGLEIPIAQVRGWEKAVTTLTTNIVNESLTKVQSQISTSTVGGATQSTSSASYVNLATTGPQLVDLPAGTYLFWFGCYLDQDADVQAAMSLDTGSGASDSDACRAGVDGIAGADQVRMSISRAIAKTQASTFTVTAKYRKIAGTADPNFGDRWLIAFRVGN